MNPIIFGWFARKRRKHLDTSDDQMYQIAVKSTLFLSLFSHLSKQETKHRQKQMVVKEREITELEKTYSCMMTRS